MEAAFRQGREEWHHGNASLGRPHATLPDAPLGAAQALIGRAISIGAPAYNTGDHQGCYDVYSCTARAILATLPELPQDAADLLRDGLARAAQLDDPDAQAWAMRHAFDAVGDLGGNSEDGLARPLHVLLSMAIAIGAPLVAVDIGVSHHMDFWLTYHHDLKSSRRHMIVIDWLKRVFDPKTYPCFRDEFIHPNDLVPLMEGVRESLGIDGFIPPRPI